MPELNGNSLDILEENIKNLRQLFPEVECDGKIDFDMLRQILGEYVDDDKERYNFKWNGKGKALRFSQTPSTGTLRPCKEESKDWDDTQNLYIEGDNLEVLKILQKSYHGKIKMIYIDPPYNTGKDFVYPDNYHDSLENYKAITGQTDEEGRKISTNTEASGRFHTDWLNMMYPRLRLARNLLTDDGVIFISIDDNEVNNLQKLCNEIFGEDNFIGLLSIENNPKGRKNSAFISVSSEYCLIFAKNKINTYFIENVPKKSSDMTLDENGRYVHNSGKRVLVGENSFNKYVEKTDSEKNYSVYYRSSDYTVQIVKEEIGETNTDLLNKGYKKYFSHNNGKIVENTYTVAKFMELFNEKALDFSDDKIYEKNYSSTIRMKSQLTNREYEAIVNGKKCNYSMELTTTGAGTDLKTIFNSSDVLFPAPKNVGLLKLLITLFDDNSFIALDFFSGSSTTADAIIQQNNIDGGNRRFICVQIPEPTSDSSEAFKAGYKNICEIGKERIRRAGEKIKNEIESGNGQIKLDEEPKAVPDIGFKVFKLDSSNLKKWNPDFDNLELTLDDMINNYVPDRTEEDVVYEFMLKMGLDLSYPVDVTEIDGKKVYSIGFGALMMCLDDNITVSVAEGMVKMYKELAPETWKVIFKDEGFADDCTKTNIKLTLIQAGLEDDAFTTV